MGQQHVVRLGAGERKELRGMVRAGAAPARAQARARILLLAEAKPGDRRWTDAAIAEALGVSSRTVARVRTAFAAGGLAAAVPRQRARRAYARRLDGAAEARLIALACSAPPTGRARWTLRLLADELVRLEVVPRIAPETVRLTLKKTISSRG